MAEKIVSPGVFTREKDLSFIAQGVSTIGASIIGPTEKGPALVPIQIEGINDFYAKFGPSSVNTYVARTVESYMANASVANIVRVLGGDKWNTTLIELAVSGSSVTSQSFAVLAPTTGKSLTTGVTNVLGTGTTFQLTVNGTAYSCSLDDTSANYLIKIFGTSPFGSKDAYVLYFNGELADDLISAVSASVMQYVTGSVTYQTPTGFQHGTTPWIQSQKLSGTASNLFRFHTIGDGDIANKEVKVGIQDIKAGTAASNNYGSFTVVVRTVNGTFNSLDLDRRPEVIETFSNLSLDPNSSNYIAKRIGDRYTTNKAVDGLNRIVASGSYANNSKYIRVEMADGVSSVSPYAVPYGFAALVQPVPTTVTRYPAATMVLTQSIDGVYDSRRFYGFDFEYADNMNYLSVTPGSNSGAGLNATFSLDDITVPSDLSGVPYAGSLANVTGSSYAAQRKFIVPFQGAFDGMVPTGSRAVGESITNSNVFGFNCSTATSTGTVQYKKALDAIANAEEVDTNLIVLPGIIYSLHNQVATYAKNICENRGDCFYIMDGFELNDTVLSAINVVEETPGELDSNYVAVYYPWLKVLESSTNNQIWVPPSVLMPGIFAFNDRVAYEWFAPAGLNRGGITEAIEARTKLNHSERDDLYEARINPLATFPGQGIVAWGQKDLQIKPSALDRINVRRLLINLKKFVASTSRYLVFEQNNTATRNRFLNIVNPYLASVQQKSGLYAFKVVMDETNNTPDIIDRNIMYGQIYLQPTKTAEYIIVDFNILPTGATFPNA